MRAAKGPWVAPYAFIPWAGAGFGANAVASADDLIPVAMAFLDTLGMYTLPVRLEIDTERLRPWAFRRYDGSGT